MLLARYGANDRAGLLVDHLRAELARPRRQAAIDDHEVVGAVGRELFSRDRRNGSIVSEQPVAMIASNAARGHCAFQSRQARADLMSGPL